MNYSKPDNTIIGMCPRCGGSLTNGHQCSPSCKEGLLPASASPAGYSSTRSDKDRLDWMIQNSASVHHSKDGECCWISQYDYDGQAKNRMPKSDAREAIDAAMDE